MTDFAEMMPEKENWDPPENMMSLLDGLRKDLGAVRKVQSSSVGQEEGMAEDDDDSRAADESSLQMPVNSNAVHHEREKMTMDDSSLSIAQESDGTTPRKKSFSKHVVSTLSSGLRDSQHQQRMIMDQYKNEVTELKKELQQTEQLIVAQKLAWTQDTARQLEEQKAVYEAEMERLVVEKEKVLASADKAAAEAMERCRQMTADLKREVERIRMEHNDKVSVAVAEAIESLQQEHSKSIENLKAEFEVEKRDIEVQGELIELELLEALDRNDDLQEEYDAKISQLENQIKALQAQIDSSQNVADQGSSRMETERMRVEEEAHQNESTEEGVQEPRSQTVENVVDGDVSTTESSDVAKDTVASSGDDKIVTTSYSLLGSEFASPEKVESITNEEKEEIASSLMKSPTSAFDEYRSPSRKTSESKPKKSTFMSPTSSSISKSRKTASSTQQQQQQPASRTTGSGSVNQKVNRQSHLPRQSRLAAPQSGIKRVSNGQRIPLSAGESDTKCPSSVSSQSTAGKRQANSKLESKQQAAGPLSSRKSAQAGQMASSTSVKMERATTQQVMPGKQRSLLPKYGRVHSKIPSRLPALGHGAKIVNEKATAAKKSSGSKSTAPEGRGMPLSIVTSTSYTPRIAERCSSPKTSPKELIENLLKTMPSDVKKASEMQSRPGNDPLPEEGIEATPCEKGGKGVGEKFDSLFSVWSTAKKAREGGLDHPPTPEMANIPASLKFSLSTTKKVKRVDDARSAEKVTRSQKRMKVAVSVMETPARSTLDHYSYDVHATPLIVRNEIVDVFSPEELLLSPKIEEEASTKQEFDLVALTKLQARVRGASCRAQYENSNRSAVQIQATFRMFLARKEKDHRMRAVVLLQSRSRTFLQSLKAENIRVAALLLQRLGRSFLSRRRVQVEREERRACVCIQSHVRGWIQKRSYQERRREMQSLVTTKAATCIQCYSRGLIQRKTYRKHVKGALSIQRVVRSYLARCKVERGSLEHNASVCIQRHLRGHFQRCSYVRRRNVILLLQKVARAYMVRRQDLREKQESLASVCIQRYWRGHAQHTKYVDTAKAITLLHVFGRRVIMHRRRVERASHQYKSATMLQAFWRSYSCRKAFVRAETSIRIMQQVSRAFLARRRLEMSMERSHAACTIQAFVRGRRDRSMFLTLRRSALSLQRATRVYLSQRRDARRIEAVLLIQSFWSAKAQRLCFQHQLRSAVLIQAATRGALSRLRAHRLRTQYAAAIFVQAKGRMWIQRRVFTVKLRAIRKIQSCLRARQSRMVAQRMRNETSSAIRLQAAWRRSRQLREYQKALASVVQCQRLCRSLLARNLILSLRVRTRAAVNVQRIWRGYDSRTKTTAKRLMKESALFIQRVWRGRQSRLAYGSILRAAVQVQTAIRVLLSKKQVERLRNARALTREVPQLSPPKPVEHCGDVMSVQKTARKPLTKRKPLGDATPRIESVFSPVKTRTRGVKIAVESDNENAMNTQRNAPDDTKEKVGPAQQWQGKTAAEIEQLKVVELRELLLEFGVEKKDLRNLRKAQLVNLVIEKAN